jgi:hypothetical protein
MEFEAERETWRSWWSESNGYYYSPDDYDETPEEIVVEEQTANFLNPPPMGSCFVAGTPVWTVRGLVAIDHLALGDRVLSMNTETGELAYRAIVERTVRPQTEITNFTVSGETIGATPVHPIWVSGKGWVRVKELKSGDPLRGAGSLPRLSESSAGEAAMAYNLVVADFHTFFVGQSKILVHDHTPVITTDGKVPGLERFGQQSASFK